MNGATTTTIRAEDLDLLRVFADGESRSFRDIARRLGIQLGPMSPIEITRRCAPLVEAGLLEHAGALSNEYRITAEGAARLAETAAPPSSVRAAPASTPGPGCQRVHPANPWTCRPSIDG